MNLKVSQFEQILLLNVFLNKFLDRLLDGRGNDDVIREVYKIYGKNLIRYGNT
jgi:hypothetical protein